MRMVSVLLAAAAEIRRVRENAIEAGASVDSKDRDEITPLISASEKGHTEVVHLLLEGASVDVFSVTEFSPLTLACAHGHKTIVEKLLQAGAQISLQNQDNVTAIMYAASGGHQEVGTDADQAQGRREQGTHTEDRPYSGRNQRDTQGGGGPAERKADVTIEDQDGVNTVMTAAS